jgi:DNA helicase HerA-like ATPase
MTDITNMASVVGVSPDLIQIEVSSTEEYAQLDQQLEIGSYLKISDDGGSTMVAIVQSYRIRDRVGGSEGMEVTEPTFVIDAQPVGRLEDGKFRRGGKQIAIPPKHVEIASSDLLAEIYDTVDSTKRFSFGTLAQDSSVRVVVDGDKFFGKHIGVVGSTGSGKSCTVAKILQEGIKGSDSQVKGGILNNSHVIIFDLHGEYAPAFPTARLIDAEDLKLPYWLMNSEELEEMFIESHEQNSHNQVSQFRQAVIENKQRHNPNIGKTISYDSPVYFSLVEVIRYLANLNAEVIGRAPEEGYPKLESGDLVKHRPDVYFDGEQKFVPTVSSGSAKATIGPFHGEFNRFLMRLEGRYSDTRLAFLLAPMKPDKKSEYKTEDLAALLEHLIGYGGERANVTIINLSGIPFEVLSVVVSLMTRLIFTFNFYLKKSKKPTDERELPFLLVYEEAHNYIPQSEGARYGSVKKAIERIAKEGRKYGISLMIISQRPSEISETVFSQCNNFVAMRLTNPTDQRYVKRLLPDNLNVITDALPSLERQEAIVIGDSVSVPSLVCVDEVTDRPDSHDIAFHTEWKLDWLDVAMTAALERWSQ